MAMHFVASGGLYGIERVILALLPALEQAGWATELVCFVDPAGGGRQVGHALQKLGGVAHFVPVGGTGYVRGMLQLLRLLRSRAPGLVHVHGYKASILAGGAALLSGVPVVATYHGEARKSVGLGWQLAVERRVLRWFRQVIAVSEPIRDELVSRGVKKDRVDVINNAVPDPGRRWPGPVTPRRLVTIGRLVPGKRIDLVIDAVAALKTRIETLRLEVLGDGPLAEPLRDQVRRLGLTERVSLHGFVEDVPRALADADCLVLASETEGMPMAVLEAMALGVPVVATAVGSLPSLAEGDRNLLLVRPGSREDLVAALERLLLDPSLAATLSRNARMKYERDHLPSRSAAEYLRVYRSVCG